MSRLLSLLADLWDDSPLLGRFCFFFILPVAVAVFVSAIVVGLLGGVS